MDLIIGVIVLFIVVNIVRMLLGSGSRRPTQRTRINHADEWRSQPFNFPATGSMPHSTHAFPPAPIIVEQPIQYGNPAPGVDTLGVAIGTAAAIGLGGIAAYEIEQAVDNAQNWTPPDQPTDTFGVNFPDNSATNDFSQQTDNSWSIPSFDASSFSTPSFDSSPSMDTSSTSTTSSGDF